MHKVIKDVYLLKPGKLVRDAAGVIKFASSSVVLIIDQEPVIVDTALSSDWGEIESALSSIGMHAGDISVVVNTHLHHDHTGCNSKFVNAVNCAHGEQIGSLTKRRQRDLRPVPNIISGRISVIDTPGHCHGHISVVFEGEKTVVAAGDAIPTINNYIERVPPRIHFDGEIAMESFHRIEKIADIIIPGHDMPINVKKQR